MKENEIKKLKDAKFPIVICDHNTPATYRVKSFSLPYIDHYVFP